MKNCKCASWRDAYHYLGAGDQRNFISGGILLGFGALLWSATILMVASPWLEGLNRHMNLPVLIVCGFLAFVAVYGGRRETQSALRKMRRFRRLRFSGTTVQAVVSGHERIPGDRRGDHTGLCSLYCTWTDTASGFQKVFFSEPVPLERATALHGTAVQVCTDRRSGYQDYCVIIPK